MSKEILLQNQVLIYLFSQSLLLILSVVAFIGTLIILKNWNFKATTPKQYQLEKISYLIILIITISLYLKIILVPYFAYSIDELSLIVPGAMCAAGIINANEFGTPLLFLKFFIIWMIGIWLIINSADLKAKDYPYLKQKFYFFLLIFALIVLEFTLEILYFSNISVQKPVSCCSVIFGLSGNNGIPFGLNITTLNAIFYLIFILNIILALQKSKTLLAIFSLFFLYISYYTVINFFGTYIYQLPTHICPFCMLQKEYFFIGYFIWSSLFLGIFFSISNFILNLIINKEIDLFYRYSIIFNTIFVILSSLYPIVYYIKNGVWL